MNSELLYQIALALCKGTGSVTAKSLLAYCGSAEAIFRTPLSKLSKIPGIGEIRAKQIRSKAILTMAEEELRFMDKHGIKSAFFSDPDYPVRLKHCVDSPVLLFYKGNLDLNAPRSLAFVGTRSPSQNGIDQTEKFIEELAPYKPQIISGLAYGIDIVAHKTALKNHLSSIAVLAFSLEKMYPSLHKKIADELLELGGWVSEYPSGHDFIPSNFASRNRIIAGMSDSVIVMESGIKGGSMITADLANGYNKDVYASPGRVKDKTSKGCNYLIKTNKAALLDDINDLVMDRGWVEEEQPKIAKQLSLDLPEEHLDIITELQKHDQICIDELALSLNKKVSELGSILLDLELEGLVSGLPGKRYTIK